MEKKVRPTFVAKPTVVTEEGKKYAKAFLRAIEIHEESYDKKASDAATAKADEYRHENPNSYLMSMPDYGQFYMKTKLQAAEEASIEVYGNTSMTIPIYMHMYGAWNDMTWWSQDQLGIERTE
jgi:hypothetical protein